MTLFVLAGHASAVDWTVGTNRVGSLSASSDYRVTYYGEVGLHVRCDVTRNWNIGVTGLLDQSHIESSSAVNNTETPEIDERGETQNTAWVLASVGRRVVSTHRLRCDVLATGGYDRWSSEGDRWGPDESKEAVSWSMALALRPEVRAYRNLWVTGQFGIRWITTDSSREEAWPESGRRTLRQFNLSKLISYGGFSEYQLGLLWTF